MATPAQIRAAVDSRLAALLPTIQAHQDNYFAAHGNTAYFQGLKTHSVTPADGATAAPDVGTTTPSYQSTPWPAGIRTTPIEMALECHQYVGPDERRGYVLFASVLIAGRLFGRSRDSGPEPWRTFPWTDITPVGP